MFDQPTHSPALVQAAQADRQRLQDAWQQLQEQRTELVAELELLETSLDEINAAMRRLGEIIGDELQLPLLQPLPNGTSVQLSGAVIRSVAVAVALQDSRRELPWHYTDWFEAVVNAGHSIKGSDPQAVFLTQLSRSPLTTRCTESGCYRLNRMALVELSAQLDDLRTTRNELVHGHPASVETDDLDLTAARLQRITADIGKAERRLDEALTTVRELDSKHWFAPPKPLPEDVNVAPTRATAIA